jgi:hypothetical protein
MSDVETGRRKDSKEQEDDAWFRQMYPDRLLEDGRFMPGWITIIYWGDRFLGWGTTDKHPVVYNVDPSDFHRSLSYEWGPYSEFAASAHMRLAKQYGTDLGPSVTPQDVVKSNKLGDHGEELTLNQILEKFVLKGMDPETESHFGVIEMDRPLAKNEIRKHNKWQESLVQKKIKEHKKACSKAGFPFPSQAGRPRTKFIFD